MTGGGLQVFFTASQNSETIEIIGRALKSPAIRETYLSDCNAKILKFALDADQAKDMGARYFISAAPPPKDPRRAGTYAGMVLVAVTLLLIGGQWVINELQMWRNNIYIAENKALDKILTGKENQIETINKDISTKKRAIRLIEDPKHYNPILLKLLEVLMAKTPRYTRISSIREMKEECLELVGCSMSQRSIVTLEQALHEGMDCRKIRIIPEEVGNTGTSNERRFKFTLKKK